MVLDLPPPQKAEHNSANERFRPPAPITRAITPFDPSSGFLQTISFRKSYLALNGDREPMRLLEEPKILIDRGLNIAKLEGWGISVDADKLSAIPREMARRFMKLWQDVEHNRLSEEDQGNWEHIVSTVDMDAFYLSLSQPRYLEGQRAGGDLQAHVRWPDQDQSERVPDKFLGEFSLLDPGEWFGAYFRFDLEGKITSVERLVQIPPPEADLWNEWPAKVY